MVYFVTLWVIFSLSLSLSCLFFGDTWSPTQDLTLGRGVRVSGGGLDVAEAGGRKT
jgi:hypothetical protein